MGLVYTLVRTFPFWAIPLGIALLTAALATRGGNKKKKVFYMGIGISLLGTSAYFLYAQGHVEAVPFVHRMFYGKEYP